MAKTNSNLEGTIKTNLSEIKKLKQEIEILQLNVNNTKIESENVLMDKMKEA